ncbi:MAG: hypothetical protein F3740_01450 [Nitrospinae bacterium]|nr:hypothetical protein [Nitrospinota bacterium]
MDTIAHFYREINSGFLNKNCGQGFEVSYLAEYDENDDPVFRKFVDYTPENHEKIKKMMEADDCMEFFIHETDLKKYYKNFKMEGHFDMRILVNFIKLLADAAAARVSASRSGAAGSRQPNKQTAASA